MEENPPYVRKYPVFNFEDDARTIRAWVARENVDGLALVNEMQCWLHYLTAGADLT
jgi:hypothetical protein